MSRDGYYEITTVWKDGFTHTNGARGFQVSSMIKFSESLFWIESAKYKEITEKEYDKKYNAPLGDEVEPKPKRRRAKASTEERPERNRRLQKDKGSVDRGKSQVKKRVIAKTTRK